MSSTPSLSDPQLFSETLFEKMKAVFPGLRELELYEFRYGLADLLPLNGWSAVRLDSREQIEARLNSCDFYRSIKIKPHAGDRIVLDAEIVRLAQMLFLGLVTGEYPPDWVSAHFYFDIRGFYFLHRTNYFTEKVLRHFGGHPFRRFEQKQKQFERLQDLGYRAFREANAEVDQLFIQCVMKLITKRGTPSLLAIAGATAAGKTEIVDRLGTAFQLAGQKTTSIEMDNFFTDRDDREARGIDSQGKEALHLGLLKEALADLTRGRRVSIPVYNSIDGTSSHDGHGRLKTGRSPLEIEPADIIFIEGNFPFLIEEILPLIGIKVVYLADDHVRMKRKWKRDIDYRKKYDISYFRNRYFKDQFIMAQIAYLPQLEACDLCVDTTGAALWTTPEIARILKQG